jgi:hypothetical protein
MEFNNNKAFPEEIQLLNQLNLTVPYFCEPIILQRKHKKGR